MVDVEGEVKITDWSVTEPLDTSGNDARGNASPMQGITGTIQYMPPEQLRGQVDAGADVYALGVTLTVALSGKDVFPSTPPVSSRLMTAVVLRDERDTVATLAPSAPPALQALLECMMHLDRELRPCADELVDAFHDIAVRLGGDSLSTDPHPVRQRFASRVQEHYQEPRQRPRLRLLQGGRSTS